MLWCFFIGICWLAGWDATLLLLHCSGLVLGNSKCPSLNMYNVFDTFTVFMLAYFAVYSAQYGGGGQLRDSMEGKIPPETLS